MLKKLFGKYKSQIGDSIWSILGLVLMNLVAQIAVYPLLARHLGDDGYGDLQYLMAYINVLAISVGAAANYARITAPAEERMRDNGDYHLFLLMVCAVGVPLVFVVCRFGGVQMSPATAICYYLLFFTMTFRYYADVAFKLTLNYKRYFLYYAIIGTGYGVGAWLFLQTGIWPLALIPGEAAGVLFAFLCGDTLRRGILRPTRAWRRVWHAVALLCLSEGISNLIANADRLMLKIMIDATAVTIYYLATLVGKTMSLVSTPLNSVLLGYLARYDGGLSRKTVHKLLVGSLAAIALFTGVCWFGGFVVLVWLYPAQLEEVRPFLFVGSVAQVTFFVTNTLTVILIRFAKKIYQVWINLAFAVGFFGFGIPATLAWGLWGFAYAMVAATALRWLVTILLAYRHTRGETQEEVSV